MDIFIILTVLVISETYKILNLKFSVIHQSLLYKIKYIFLHKSERLYLEEKVQRVSTSLIEIKLKERFFSEPEIADTIKNQLL